MKLMFISIGQEYAFEKNPYPVVLSLENHCSEEQQVSLSHFPFKTMLDSLCGFKMTKGRFRF